MKVLCFSIFIPFFFGNSKTDNDKEAKIYLDNYQIELNTVEENVHSKKKSLPTFDQIRIFENRLNEAERSDARYQRLKEIKMWKIIEEFLTYFIYLLIISILIYSNQNSNSHFQVQHLRNYFINSRQIDNNYLKVSFFLKFFF